MKIEPDVASRKATWVEFLSFSDQARHWIEARPQWSEWVLGEQSWDSKNAPGPAFWRRLYAEEGSKQARREDRLEALRLVRELESIRIGWWDFAGYASLEEVVEWLSNLADFCLETVYHMYWSELSQRYGKPATGFAIISLGKLGGQELNYGSDIDVLFLYGEEGVLRPHETYHAFFTTLAQCIVRAFEETGPNGRLFRMDLRLRPEGPSGPLVRSLESLENYYAAFGETWERLALVKARWSAGDPRVGYELEKLRIPFCFPLHVTEEIFEEMAEIRQRMEELADRETNGDWDVKRGTGGIREIEFLVQTFQVLHGARQPYLQQRSTLRALHALGTVGLLRWEEVRSLREAYRFLRVLEHRLQMMTGLQTHRLPGNGDLRQKIASSLGLTKEKFEERLVEVRQTVRELFNRYFYRPSPNPPKAFRWELFADPKAAEKALADLERGHGAAPSPGTRRVFRRFVPLLEEALRRVADPDGALQRLVQFVDRYGARRLLFESLASHPKALDLLVRLFDASSFFSEVLIAQPDLFEEVARSGTLDTLKRQGDYLEELRQLPGQPAERARKYRRWELVRIALRDVLGIASLTELWEEYTALARACLTFAHESVCPKARLAWIGVGRFGAGELGYGSDLDCLVVGEEVEAALAVIAFMTETLPTGILFPMDFRLRPHGEGPVCVPLETYEEYYARTAQFWEIQVLTKATWVAGDPALGARFMESVERVWNERIAQTDHWEEIEQMRMRVEKERADRIFPPGSFKTGPGGLMDIEFGLTAYLMDRRIRQPHTLQGLALLQEDHPEIAQKWQEGFLFLRKVESFLRRDRNRPIDRLPPDCRARRWLARRLGFPDEKAFISFLVTTCEANREAFLLLWRARPRKPH
ncbi:[protein-PII] uridylyltransferase family protein [Candidatus Methylacidithermus pantelleriae]|uniref:Bifunctional glutamine synthetase adenylyltransferase/adenylyl-removing enzyme n=1 Tax=Candidatus Methylacidithermus pantelleriae TaxID=2744239 RepID=A0A8J2BN05_9BACT|nr:glutamine-synthetase adenylyltransferase [Candidatus Methylacidithermus pantelleriae]CAF0694634.1 Bifunctional glutamine synthetase adenylyltransferase/adenylyl-removing enzyme [Candidatus Methylacidithermus pantelleriae]